MNWNPTVKITLAKDAPSYSDPSASVTIRMFGNRLQQTFMEQDPDIPWHLQTLCMRDLNALRPASLLCKFMSPISDRLFSESSMNFREKSTP